MIKRALLILVIIILTGLFSTTVLAFEIPSPKQDQAKFGVGMELMFPFSYEVSFVYNITDSLAIQGMLSPMELELGSFTGGKLLYRFARKDSYNVYFFGLTGKFEESNENMELESVTGSAVGIGVEYSSDFVSDNIRNSFEFGYADISFSDKEYSFYCSYGFRVYF